MVARLSDNHASQRNGEAVKAEVGASHNDIPPSADASRKDSPMSW